MKTLQMNSDELFSLLTKNSSYTKLNSFKSNRVLLTGVTSSSIATVVCSYVNAHKSINIVIAPSKDAAAYLDNDLNEFNHKNEVCYFPSSFKKSILYGGDNPSGLVQRISLLSKIKSLDKSSSLIICTYPDAIGEKVVSSVRYEKNILNIEVNKDYSIANIQQRLIELSFVKVDFVYEPGQFSVRGGIIDIFSYSNNFPYRIDTFGDTIDSIRLFDIGTQRSVDKVDKISIIPNLSSNEVSESRVSLIEFIRQTTSRDANIWAISPQETLNSLKAVRSKLSIKLLEKGGDTESLFERVTSEKEFLALIEPLKHFCLKDSFDGVECKKVINFNHISQPSFHKNFEMIAQNFHENNINGFKTFLLTHNKAQVERLENIFNSVRKDDCSFENLPMSLHEGFIDLDSKIALYVDHNIFERYHKYKISNELKKPESITIAELNALENGDYVVHIDYGIGRFGGIVKSMEGGIARESVRLIYKDNDTLFVNVHAIHKISKYRDKENTGVKLHKLGSSTWQKFKSTAKSKVKDIAKDLIALYAKRKQQKGFQFSADSYLQKELEASFMYEDTPDQEKATIAVKKEMESSTPMDMLICGDVGFGKTEIAMRAAFKAITDGKQVAILVPTTVLALQHYRTFNKRLKDFPVTIESVSRVKTAKQVSEIAKSLEDGKLDILIGTHKLLSSQFKFKDLGLLIIDEEQKFGVTTKEKLRTMKVDVDTLTLTATPIPRTLQFSLMGARDLVVINTPPPNRQPVTTQVHVFDTALMKEAIDYELGRNGQVFIIHNRVDSLYSIKEIVSSLCPNAKIAVGHGQMKPSELETIMMDFIYGEVDILISTTIIESGIDIPNANTMIINDAQNFGLSALHQLRGRVGRTNRKAFCYLFTPRSGHISSNGAKRLHAIEDFSELGSGLNIAMQDLDIRGAGNILGSEQSGFISDIGYETYYKILNEAMIELKGEGIDSIVNKGDDSMPKNIKYVNDCTIDTLFEAFIPDSYISNTNEKMRMYRSIDSIDDFEKLDRLQDSMLDRFGKTPIVVENLINLVKIRKIAIELGIEKVILKNGRYILHFVYNSESQYYKNPLFMSIMKYVATKGDTIKFKSVNNINLLTMDNTNTTQLALNVILEIKKMSIL